MAIRLQGNGGLFVEADGTRFRAVRVTTRAPDYGALGTYRIGMSSGTMAALLGADAELFQFRWPDASRLALLWHVTISAGADSVPIATANLSFALSFARLWTVAGSGGTRAVLTGNISKLRTSMGASLVNDAGIADTAGLTPGTKVIDHATTNQGQVSFSLGTSALTALPQRVLLPDTALFGGGERMDMPVVFAQNEGFVIRNGAVAWPNTMTWTFSVNVLWSEVAAF